MARKNAAAIQRQFLLERSKSRVGDSSSDDSDLESEKIAAEAHSFAKVVNICCEATRSFLQ
jgi:hypothetical protein